MGLQQGAASEFQLRSDSGHDSDSEYDSDYDCDQKARSVCQVGYATRGGVCGSVKSIAFCRLQPLGCRPLCEP